MIAGPERQPSLWVLDQIRLGGVPINSQNDQQLGKPLARILNPAIAAPRTKL